MGQFLALRMAVCRVEQGVFGGIKAEILQWAVVEFAADRDLEEGRSSKPSEYKFSVVSLDTSALEEERTCLGMGRDAR
jgi:hypothetical protein